MRGKAYIRGSYDCDLQIDLYAVLSLSEFLPDPQTKYVGVNIQFHSVRPPSRMCVKAAQPSQKSPAKFWDRLENYDKLDERVVEKCSFQSM